MLESIWAVAFVDIMSPSTRRNERWSRVFPVRRKQITLPNTTRWQAHFPFSKNTCRTNEREREIERDRWQKAAYPFQPFHAFGARKLRFTDAGPIQPLVVSHRRNRRKRRQNQTLINEGGDKIEAKRRTDAAVKPSRRWSNHQSCHRPSMRRTRRK